MPVVCISRCQENAYLTSVSVSVKLCRKCYNIHQRFLENVQTHALLPASISMEEEDSSVMSRDRKIPTLVTVYNKYYSWGITVFEILSLGCYAVHDLYDIKESFLYIFPLVCYKVVVCTCLLWMWFAVYHFSCKNLCCLRQYCG